MKTDPSDFTERATRAGACWQVWCEQQMLMRTLAREAVFHGDHPIAEVTRFLQDLLQRELRETYARMMLQASLDWLTSGLDFRESYREHATQLWGAELVAKLDAWWLAAFEPYYSTRIAAHVADLTSSGPPAVTHDTEPAPSEAAAAEAR